MQRSHVYFVYPEKPSKAFDKHDEANFLKVQLINAMNTPQQAIHKIDKLLIVSEPKKTTMYMTLKSPNVIHIVKRLLKTLFEKFGNEGKLLQGGPSRRIVGLC